MKDHQNWQDVINQLFSEANPYLEVRGDHAHIRVSHEMALKLLEIEGGDPRIVEPAVILHDVGWSTLEPEEIKNAYGVKATGEKAKQLNRKHELGGVEIAGKILAKLGYDPDLTGKILKIIERHDSGLNADTLEEEIVKDADKLWRFSNTGFWLEQKRQGVPVEVFLKNRSDKLEAWFFRQSSKDLAWEMVEARKAEMEQKKE